jgi:hypothetical protein
VRRIDQALRWWKNHVPEGTWKVDAEVPKRHSSVLYRTGRLRSEWRGDGEAREPLSERVFWKLEEDAQDG